MAVNMKFRILFISLLFISASGLFSQPVDMYVNSLVGLRVRNSASINGERIGLLPHLARIHIIDDEIDFVTIDNIKGKWVLMEWLHYKENGEYGYLRGWVFNGYLMNYCEYNDYLKNINFEQILPTDDVMNKFTHGIWYNNTGYWFLNPGELMSGPHGYQQYSKTSNEIALGSWYVRDNLLILNYIGTLMHGGFYLIKDPNIFVYTFVFLGSETLILKSDYGTVIYFKGEY